MELLNSMLIEEKLQMLERVSGSQPDKEILNHQDTKDTKKDGVHQISGLSW